MKLTVNSKDFADRITAVGKIIPEKSSILALTKMLLDITPEHIYLTGRNGEGITVMTSVMVSSIDRQESIKVCVDYKILGNAMKGIPSQIVEISIEKSDHDYYNMTVSHESGCFSVATTTGDDYIIPKAVTPVHTTVVQGERMIKALSSTLSCIIDDTKWRPIMSCMCVDQRLDQLAFAGFNNKCGFIYSDHSVTANEAWKTVVPVAAAKFLRNAINKKSTVRIDDCSDSVRFTCSIGTEIMSSMSITITIPEGKYPPYERTIPAHPNSFVTIDRSTFSNVLDRISNFIDEASGMITITMTDKDKISVEGRDVVNANEAVETIKCDCEGESYSFNVSCKSLHDILKEMTADEVVLSIVDPLRGILISSPSDDGDIELRSLVMPMAYPNNPNQVQ